MLFAALFNAVYLHNVHFLLLIFANAFVYMLFLGLLTVCLFQILSCIKHSASNQLIFLILCFHRFALEIFHLKTTIIVVIIIIMRKQCHIIYIVRRKTDELSELLKKFVLF